MTSEAGFCVGNTHFFSNIHAVRLNGLAGYSEQLRNFLYALAVFDHVGHFNFGFTLT